MVDACERGKHIAITVTTRHPSCIQVLWWVLVVHSHRPLTVHLAAGLDLTLHTCPKDKRFSWTHATRRRRHTTLVLQFVMRLSKSKENDFHKCSREIARKPLTLKTELLSTCNVLADHVTSTLESSTRVSPCILKSFHDLEVDPIRTSFN